MFSSLAFKLVAGAVVLSLIGGGLTWLYYTGKADGKEQVRAEVRKVLEEQKERTAKEVAKVWERKLASEKARRDALEQGLLEIRNEAEGCAVSPAFKRALERLRNTDGERDNPDP